MKLDRVQDRVAVLGLSWTHGLLYRGERPPANPPGPGANSETQKAMAGRVVGRRLTRIPACCLSPMARGARGCALNNSIATLPTLHQLRVWVCIPHRLPWTCTTTAGVATPPNRESMPCSPIHIGPHHSLPRFDGPTHHTNRTDAFLCFPV